MRKTLLLFISFIFCWCVYAENYPSLRDILNSQINNSVIDIPKGTYVLDLVNIQDAYAFRNKKNVIINGNGSTIICNRQSQAFYFENCENLTFSNFFIEYDPPCSTQGTIMAINGSTWDVAVHDGYPAETETDDYSLGLGRVQVYDKDNRELVRNYTTTSASSCTKTGDHMLSLVVNNPSSSVKVGDYVALDVVAKGWVGAHTIILSNCKQMKLDNIVVYDSNCFSFLEYDCEQTHYYRCKVTRKVGDPKYSQDRVRAGIADALHSKYAKVGPIIEECILEHSGDDCIAINGNFYPIYKVDQASGYVYFLTTESSLNGVRVKAKDNVVCVNNDGTVRGRSVAEEISFVSPYPSQSEINACFAKLSSVTNKENYTKGVRVKLATWVNGLAVGDVFYSNDRIGSGFKVINNQVGHNRSRAILIKASDGIIQGNTIEGSGMSGIAIAPEFYWMEAGCSSNVEIANNTIRNCMFDANMDWTSQAGALVVVAQAPNGKLAPAGTFQNIHIHGNTIEGCPQPCVFLNAIEEGYFYDNTIVPDPNMIRTHGSSFGVSNSRPIEVINCVYLQESPPVGITGSRTDSKHIFIDANGYLRLDGLSGDEQVLVSIYDMFGSMIKSQRLDKSDILPISLSKGVYIIVVQGSDTVFSEKVIIP